MTFSVPWIIEGEPMALQVHLVGARMKCNYTRRLPLYPWGSRLFLDQFTTNLVCNSQRKAKIALAPSSGFYKRS